MENKMISRLPDYAFRKRLMWARVVACLLISILAVVTLSITVVAHDDTALEEQVKAAMIFKFLSYVDWPKTAFSVPEEPLRVWVLGASRIGNELRDAVAERTVNGRPVDLFAVNGIHEITKPHAVFVGLHAERYLPELARLAEQEAFLIITENSEGLHTGSTINLRLIDGRMGFDVSLTSAQLSNLKLSARLLSVASSVEQE